MNAPSIEHLSGVRLERDINGSARRRRTNATAGIPIGKFFLIIVAISIALVLGTAVVVTYF
jgi:hypothetical protein